MLSRFLEIAFKYAKALVIKQVAGEDSNLPIPKEFAVTAATNTIHMMAAKLEDSTLEYLQTKKGRYQRTPCDKARRARNKNRI